MNRKKPRLKNYNYSENGAYFITFCVKDMKCILSRIVGSGDPDAPTNESDGFISAETVLLSFGKILEKNINRMNSIYKDIRVDKYVIMPNHVHMIIIIENKGASGSPLPTNNKLSSFVGTLKRFCDKEYGRNIWQTGFYDHIIRDENDYLIRWQYIDENPKKWYMGKDKYYA